MPQVCSAAGSVGCDSSDAQGFPPDQAHRRFVVADHPMVTLQSVSLAAVGCLSSFIKVRWDLRDRLCCRLGRSGANPLGSQSTLLRWAPDFTWVFEEQQTWCFCQNEDISRDTSNIIKCWKHELNVGLPDLRYLFGRLTVSCLRLRSPWMSWQLCFLEETFALREGMFGIECTRFPGTSD